MKKDKVKLSDVIFGIILAVICLATFVLGVVLDTRPIKAEESESAFDIGCHVYRDTNQSIPDNFLTPIEWTNERYDLGDMHEIDVDNEYVYIQEPGKYLIETSVAFAANVDGYREISIVFNDGYADRIIQNKWPGSIACRMDASVVRELEAGEYISVIVRHTAGGNLNLQAGYYEPSLQVQRIGLGGEMDVSLTLPTGFYVLMAAFGLLFISFFLKSPLIYLALIPCLIGVILEPAFQDLWLQAGCGLAAFWSALKFWNSMTQSKGRIK